MESDSILPQLLLQLVLIAVNALFAATEIAVISLNETKVRRMAEGGDRKAAKMLRMVTEPTGFLSTIQICITLAGFLGSAFAADNFSDKLVNWLINDCEVSGVSPSALDTISVIIITLVYAGARRACSKTYRNETPRGHCTRCKRTDDRNDNGAPPCNLAADRFN